MPHSVTRVFVTWVSREVFFLFLSSGRWSQVSKGPFRYIVNSQILDPAGLEVLLLGFEAVDVSAHMCLACIS